MILYHGSNVIVEQPNLSGKIAIWTSVLDFTPPLTAIRQ